MKIKTIAVLGMAAAVMLCGCGNNDSDSSQSGDSENESAVVDSSDDIDASTVGAPKNKVSLEPGAKVITAAPFTKISTVTTTKPKVRDDMKTSIFGNTDIGINMSTPKGVNIYNGKREMMIQPDVIPTADAPLTVYNDSGNKVNIFASAGIDYSEFDDLKQEDMEKEYLDSVKDTLENADVISYTAGTYANHKGIRMDVSAKLDGVDIKQTVLKINGVRENTNNGYCYTITYTDVDGDMQDEIEESISTIKLSAGLLYAMYETPEECAQAQKDGSFNISDASKYRFKTPGNLFKTDGTPVELP